MLRVLIIEDSFDDAELIAAALRVPGAELGTLRVDSAGALWAALSSESWDGIISDFHVPGLGAAGALAMAKERGYDGPFIVVSSVIGEETAVGILKAGAHDFVMKSNLARLRPALDRELNDAAVRREHARAAAALAVSERQLRELTETMHAVREETQARIARELHDELGQVLTGLDLEISQMARKFAASDVVAARRFEAMRGMLGGAVDSVRRIANELRPAALDELGLAAAIDGQLRKLRRQTGADIELKLSHAEFDIAGDAALAAFRVVQESLTNVARHARAGKVAVSAEMREQTLTIEVTDNGSGFAAASGGRAAAGFRPIGLLGMRERVQQLGGTLSVGSTNRGTTVRAVIPCSHCAIGRSEAIA